MTKENSPSESPKQTLAEEWLRGDHIMVHLDARRDGVKVPANLISQAGLSLKISYLFNAQPYVDEHGIFAPLRFGSEYFECFMPWGSIWGITSEKGELRIWPDSVPVELLMGVAPGSVADVSAPATAPVETPTEEKRKRPKLTLVK